METFKSGAVARVFGRSANWIRDLEQRGIIPPAPRDFANFRVYRAEDIERIRQILTSRGNRRRNGGAAPA